jgi:hypothetical protein
MIGARAARPSPETARDLWAIELLEDFATPEAQHLLKKLAEGAPESWAAREATAALKRRER